MTTSQAVQDKPASFEIPTLPALKRVREIRPAPQGHWVGDGFPVRTIFSYDNAHEVTPFLLMDHAGPFVFSPSDKRRGVGEHPHRGFETVTILYSGEVEHRDSGGGGGKIGPGDVQWMTAGSGVVHEEMHSDAFTKSGGVFEAIQLWVNLPAAQKMTAPKYQTILSDQVAEVTLDGGAGSLRVIAGHYGAEKGPADTFTPVNLWELRLQGGRQTVLEMPSGHTAALFVLKGTIAVNGSGDARAHELVLLDRQGEGLQVQAKEDATILVLGGAPIDEKVVGYGPFVMNSEDEIRTAIGDYQNGRMGHLKR